MNRNRCWIAIAIAVALWPAAAHACPAVPTADVVGLSEAALATRWGTPLHAVPGADGTQVQRYAVNGPRRHPFGDLSPRNPLHYAMWGGCTVDVVMGPDGRAQGIAGG